MKLDAERDREEKEEEEGGGGGGGGGSSGGGGLFKANSVNKDSSEEPRYACAKVRNAVSRPNGRRKLCCKQTQCRCRTR